MEESEARPVKVDSEPLKWEAQCALHAALARAQSQFPPIPKNREVTIRPRDRAPYSFRYADLEGILSATRKPLTDNGLSLVQMVNSSQSYTAIVTRLMHEKGGVLESEVWIEPTTKYTDPKTFGGLISYMRRYAVSSMLGVAADDDLDEDGIPAGEIMEPDMGREPQPRRPERKSARPDDGQLATSGEIAHIFARAKAVGADVQAVLDDLGIDLPPTLEGMTKAQFDAIRAKLKSM